MVLAVVLAGTVAIRAVVAVAIALDAVISISVAVVAVVIVAIVAFAFTFDVFAVFAFAFASFAFPFFVFAFAFTFTFAFAFAFYIFSFAIFGSAVSLTHLFIVWLRDRGLRKRRVGGIERVVRGAKRHGRATVLLDGMVCQAAILHIDV